MLKDHTVSNLTELAQLNIYKEELQKLRPVLELIKIKADPTSFVGRERDEKLRFMGYTRKQIKKMTSPGKVDKAEFWETFKQNQRKELRRLAKLRIQP